MASYAADSLSSRPPVSIETPCLVDRLFSAMLKPSTTATNKTVDDAYWQFFSCTRR
jgi:hypothetical protein